MAELVGMSRPTVNRLLLDFERGGLVRLGYGKLDVLDRPALRRIADEPPRSTMQAGG